MKNEALADARYPRRRKQSTGLFSSERLTAFSLLVRVPIFLKQKMKAPTNVDAFIFGCGIGTRTPTSRFRDCGATITLFRNIRFLRPRFIITHFLRLSIHFEAKFYFCGEGWQNTEFSLTQSIKSCIISTVFAATCHSAFIYIGDSSPTMYKKL